LRWRRHPFIVPCSAAKAVWELAHKRLGVRIFARSAKFRRCGAIFPFQLAIRPNVCYSIFDARVK